MTGGRSVDAAEAPAFDLLDEAVALLRRAPVTAFLLYYGATLPFALALLAFVGEMSRGPLASARVAPLSLLLAFLFALMKTGQSAFCAALDHLLREADPPRAPLAATAALQAAVHGAGLFLFPLAAAALLPLGWAFALLQNVTALGRRERRGIPALLRRANAQAVLWPRQNHLVLAVLAVFSLAVLANVALALLLAPQLAKTFTGSENVFTRSGLHVLNSTFFSVAFVLAWLAVDPLVKAVYTLRCFHGESLATGEDLLVPLRRLRRPAAAALLLLALARPGAAAPAPAARVSAPALDRAIGRVLKRPEFAWRARQETPAMPGGPLSDFFSSIGRATGRFFRAMGDFLLRAWRFLRDLLAPSRGGSAAAPAGSSSGFVSSRALLFGALALVAALGAILLLRSRRRARPAEVAAEPVAAPVPDPLLPTTTADLRDPEDWLVLGREWIEKGDLRRALRALYLAALGTLARGGLVTLRAARSNGEYVRELRRRAADRRELLDAFGALVDEFDRAWYGRHDVTPEGLGRVRAELERVRAHAA